MVEHGDLDRTVQYVSAAVSEKLEDLLAALAARHGILSASVVMGTRKQWNDSAKTELCI